MIQATFKKKDNQIYSYQIDGHAGFANIGNDIVCAGVSSLFIAITNKLIELGHTHYDAEGNYFVSPRIKENILLETLYDGINAIAEQYPDNARCVIIEEE